MTAAFGKIIGPVFLVPTLVARKYVELNNTQNNTVAKMFKVSSIRYSEKLKACIL